jgi:hypothetical protein
MRVWKILAAASLAAALGGCVLPYHEENPALVMVRPAAPPRELAVYAPPNNDYPTVGGDILKGVTAYPAATETPPAPPPR